MGMSASRSIRAGLLAAMLSVPALGDAYKGRVIDGVTGQPIEGVYVMGVWSVGGGFVVSSSGCKLAIDRSNAKGEFELIGGVGFWGKLLGPRSLPFVIFYKRGYVTTAPLPADEFSWRIERDSVDVSTRLNALLQLEEWLDCGVAEVVENKDQLVPVYQAMVNEGAAVATTKEQLNSVISLRYWLDVIDVGADHAEERVRARRASLRSAK